MTLDFVIKLGGSHTESPLLRPWLRAAALAEAKLVLVPGGGPFADAVRAAQRALGFDDHAAHDMALMAMEQFGRALAALEPHLKLCGTLEAIHSACAAQRVPLWSPWPMLRDAPEIPTSWDVTSDSLALWLARTLCVPRLLLVKRRAPSADATCRLLSAEGLLDPAFPHFLESYHGEIRIAGPDDLPQSGINPAAPPGRVVPP